MTSPQRYSKGLESLCIEDADADPIDISGKDCNMFDEAIGHIEDVLMDPQFQDLQKNFLEKYWNEFDDSEENKLVYMEIFKEYTDVVEKYIENHLLESMKDFNMESFISLLQERKDELEGEVFEILFTFTDFLVFKEMFLDYKAVKEGRVEDLGLNIHVTSV
ncbi:ADP-ribosylation factor-like protein 2-binding protein [Frankliniella fusca]|uniref:ADP-ribosylation factor-like protein 2-binding protein n=1 Tax=Frankliniella fusca TaxID=407009 RepID=A0AAE1GU78_9NEOP|nr:ADP-ribosylation factor-like protein 2-binding protein [Frankliniella fusca]